jgi:hypothetical protein
VESALARDSLSAEAYAARALTLDPAFAVTYEHLARIATIQHRFDDALAAFNSAISSSSR